VWSWLGTTATLTAEQLLNLEDDHRSQFSNRPDPIAGFGYGLPLSRLYARYFGGDLSLTSMEGLGTDAYLHLSAIGDREECLL
jgi:pyruvate dehydrogenase kinase 2/3/4